MPFRWAVCTSKWGLRPVANDNASRPEKSHKGISCVCKQLCITEVMNEAASADK